MTRDVAGWIYRRGRRTRDKYHLATGHTYRVDEHTAADFLDKGYATRSNTDLAHELAGHVPRRTRTTLAAPRLVAKDKRVTVRGAVDGIDAGHVTLTFSAPKRKPFTRVVPITRTGAFRTVIQPRRRGRHKIHVAYPGDDRHHPSAATRSVLAL